MTLRGLLNIMLIGMLCVQCNGQTAKKDTATKIMPELLDILAALKNGKMTGSGATCFGIYDSEDEAKKACEEISKNNPQWWIRYAKSL